MDLNRQEYPISLAGIASLLRNPVVILSLVSLLAALTACSQSPCQNPNASIEACIAYLKTNPNKEIALEWVESAAEREDVEQLKRVGELPLGVEDRVEVMNLAAGYLDELNEFSGAFNLYKSISKILEENELDGLGASYFNSAYMAWAQSDYYSALSFSEKSLLHISKEEESFRIQVLLFLSSVLLDLGNNQPAKYILDSLSQELDEDVLGPYINSLISYGNLYSNQQYYGMALRYFDKALDAASGSKNYAALTGLHLNFVSAYIEVGRFEDAEKHLAIARRYSGKSSGMFFAIEYLQGKVYFLKNELANAGEALRLSLTDSHVASSWEPGMHYWLGQVYFKEKQYDLAELSFKNSIRSVEKSLFRTPVERLRLNVLKEERMAYEALFLLRLAGGDDIGAFAISERAKGSVTIKNLSEVTNAELDQLQYSGNPAVEAGGRIAALKNYLSVYEELEVNDTFELEASDFAKNDSLYMSYFVVGEEVYAALVQDGGVSVYTLGISFSELSALIDQVMVDPNNILLLEKLGEAIVVDSMLDVIDGKHLYISPDEVLSQLSFQSLRVHGKFLVEKVTMSLVPNLKFLKRLHQNSEDSRGHALAIGNPKGDLPGAELEVRWLSQKFGMDAVLGDEAVDDLFKGMAKYNFLHLSAHTGVDYLGPWVDLANRRVYGHELFSGDISLEVVVLSSCKSSMGMNIGFGASLASAFIGGGARSVVGARYSIDDVFTNVFIRKFYELYLTEGNSVRRALALAQRWAINEGYSPQQWAGFELVGY